MQSYQITPKEDASKLRVIAALSQLSGMILASNGESELIAMWHQPRWHSPRVQYCGSFAMDFHRNYGNSF